MIDVVNPDFGRMQDAANVVLDKKGHRIYRPTLPCEANLVDRSEDGPLNGRDRVMVLDIGTQLYVRGLFPTGNRAGIPAYVHVGNQSDGTQARRLEIMLPASAAESLICQVQEGGYELDVSLEDMIVNEFTQTHGRAPRLDKPRTAGDWSGRSFNTLADRVTQHIPEPRAVPKKPVRHDTVELSDELQTWIHNQSASDEVGAF